jgi:thioredoxin:protein disulfide reductase
MSFERTSRRFPSSASAAVVVSALALSTATLVLFPSVGWAADGEAGGVFERALAGGPLLLSLTAFGSGLLVSLTPCVYPMVAITVSVFGAKNAKSRRQAFALSGSFVLGLVCMFVPLGMAAALTGVTFGSALSDVRVVVGMTLVFLALAASMFGAFDLDIPHALKNKLATAGGSGYLGAFVLGLVCGPITAPCTGPFLWGVLAWVAQAQDLVLGTVAMTAFALGLGVPFFLVGAFAMQLPKSGRWMNYVKSLGGIALVAVALYLLNTAFPVLGAWVKPGWAFFGGAVGVLVLGVALGAVHRSFESEEWGVRLSKGLGVLMVSVAAFAGVTNLRTAERSLVWEKASPDQDLMALVSAAKAKAKQEGKPLFLDFTAAWCAACKEIEKHTFPDDRVQAAAGRYVSVKMDLTNDSDPAVERAYDEFGIRGLPVLVLFDSQGNEAKRFFGDFVPPDQLSTHMNQVN